MPPSTPVDLSSYRNSKEKLTVKMINEKLIPAMCERITDAQKAIPRQKDKNVTVQIKKTTDPPTEDTQNAAVPLKPDDGDSRFSLPCFNGNGNVETSKAKYGGHPDPIKEEEAKEEEAAKKKEITKKSELDHLYGQLERLQGYLTYVKVSFDELENFEGFVNDPIKAVMYRVDEIVKAVIAAPEESSRNKNVQTKLSELNEVIMKLKPQVPSAHKIAAVSDSTKHDSSTTSKSLLSGDKADGLQRPKLHVTDQFRDTPVFKNYKALYESLDSLSKVCLLCFSVFPEDEVVKQRLLLHWWIGEGYIDPEPEPRTGEGCTTRSQSNSTEKTEDITKRQGEGSKVPPPGNGTETADDTTQGKGEGSKIPPPGNGTETAEDTTKRRGEGDEVLPPSNSTDTAEGTTKRQGEGSKVSPPSNSTEIADDSTKREEEGRTVLPLSNSKEMAEDIGKRRVRFGQDTNVSPPSNGKETGEDIAEEPKNREKTAEDVADEILRNLVSTGFIEPVNKKHKWAAKSFRMHPLIRSVVIILAKDAEFIDFDTSDGNPTTEFLSTYKAFLSKEGSSFKLSSPPTLQQNEENFSESSSGNAWLDKKDSLQTSTSNSAESQNKPLSKTSQNQYLSNLMKLHTLFNVQEIYLKFDPDWFPKVKNIKVIQLGRWQDSDLHHIEVEDTKFLKRFKPMKHLKFFSLQGISRISKFPGSICSSLTNLIILDLRACHNLETLPEEISLLKSLIYLDMSECFLLEEIPKGVGSLLELQVLKGFIIVDPEHSRTACTVRDLVKLKKLRTLSISASNENFPEDTDVAALQKLDSLRSLTMIWGGASLKVQPDKKIKRSVTRKGIGNLHRVMTAIRNKQQPDADPGLPKGLKKLDLQCFPMERKPYWLNADNLKSLEKLYIRGGKLSSIRPADGKRWESVEKLCLKHLWGMKMDWTELQDMFPNMVYLEKVGCSGLVFFPCNEDGVWHKPETSTK